MIKTSILGLVILLFAGMTAKSQVKIRFDISFTEPQAHYTEVEMNISGLVKDYIDIKMPVWAPGSYLVREFAKSVEGFGATANGIRSEFEKVKHLEGIAIYGDNIIRLRIVIELLKRNVKKGLITLSVEDYKEIGYKVLRTDPSLLKSSEDIIVDGVNNWVPSMLLIPLYEDVPTKYRGKIRD